MLPIILALALAQTGCGDSAQDVQQQGLELLQIAERGDVSALDALLKRDANADYRDSCDWTPLMKAALNGHSDAVQRLLAAGADVDAKDKGGYTGLMLAASNNHADSVAMLLDRGAMIDAQELTQGFTALTWAAQRGHRETVELLIARGADKTLPDFEGKTAADRAAEQGHAATTGAAVRRSFGKRAGRRRRLIPLLKPASRSPAEASDVGAICNRDGNNSRFRRGFIAAVSRSHG